jgi:hypothetical protein
MAFKNVKLTPGQRNEFLKKNIINFYTGRILDPVNITIDENNPDLWLTWAYNFRDQIEDYIKSFYFSYENIIVEIIVRLITHENNDCDWCIRTAKIVNLNDAELEPVHTKSIDI